eukprot:CAMPEP_0175859224 /NCGR_PEP_ID=MMETSP0107_2-20121207/30132_1 /TAXON_ID=195067 ORGANISM="Goniomonas pacifica, Strain CCMP1869" /NCGR_SAMPLE_ID=MMETSP0107_2 /ASSEMBLY_ACC=CAM_ASM_000203 /LENGTH=1043 /DNA_ID=CAMNT_0017175811 /DNA_START=16 /DNA_END=3147 /DNA_ORIENTATION=+
MADDGSLSATVTGNAPGSSFAFRIKVSNGFDAYTPSSSSLVAYTQPNAPSAVTAMGSGYDLSVSWTPGDDGGDAVTSWLVEISKNGGAFAYATTVDVASARRSLRTTSVSATVSGLDAPVNVSLRVAGSNGRGVGAYSEPSDVYLFTVAECTLTHSCHSEALCTDTDASYTCECNAGYTGNGTSCDDLNECATTNGGCDSSLGVCTNVDGSFECACVTGYTGDGMSCTEINECATTNGGCDSNAACSNTAGSFECACDSAYKGDGMTCTDVNECSTDNAGCGAEACTNTAGSYACNAINCGEYTAPDSATVFPTGNIVAPNSVVITCNTGYGLSGSSTATCGSDASFSTGGTCSEVNECATSNGGCDSNAGCVNNVGSYSCSCDTGYTGDGMSCTEVNECATTNGGCDSNAACSNTAGSFECVCDSAYSGDGITCTAIPQAGCDPVTDCNSNGKCGTLGVCVCDAGYVDSNCAQYSAPAATVSVTVPANTAATASVGSAAAIVFPAGAVTSAVVVSGEAYSTNASTTSVSASAMPDGLTLHGAGAPHCVFGPAGLTFSVPVVVNMSYDPTAVNANEVQPFLRNETSGGWMSLSAGDFLYVDEANGVIVIQVHHFSTYTAYKATSSLVSGTNATDPLTDATPSDTFNIPWLIIAVAGGAALSLVALSALIIVWRRRRSAKTNAVRAIAQEKGFGDKWNLVEPPRSPEPDAICPPVVRRTDSGSNIVSGVLASDVQTASPVTPLPKGFVQSDSPARPPRGPRSGASSPGSFSIHIDSAAASPLPNSPMPAMAPQRVSPPPKSASPEPPRSPALLTPDTSDSKASSRQANPFKATPTRASPPTRTPPSVGERPTTLSERIAQRSGQRLDHTFSLESSIPTGDSIDVGSEFVSRHATEWFESRQGSIVDLLARAEMERPPHTPLSELQSALSGVMPFNDPGSAPPRMQALDARSPSTPGSVLSAPPIGVSPKRPADLLAADDADDMPSLVDAEAWATRVSPPAAPAPARQRPVRWTSESNLKSPTAAARKKPVQLSSGRFVLPPSDD